MSSLQGLGQQLETGLSVDLDTVQVLELGIELDTEWLFERCVELVLVKLEVLFVG